MYIPFLNRSQAKTLAVALIFAGVFLAPDILAPTPGMDAFLNLPLAMVIAAMTTLSYTEAFVITYVISGILIVLGLLVYPYNTRKLINGRAKAAWRFIQHNPFLVLLSVTVLIGIYLFGQVLYGEYEEMLRLHITKVLTTAGL